MKLLFTIFLSIVSQTISLSLKCSQLDDRLDYPNKCKQVNTTLPTNFKDIQKDQMSHLVIEHGIFNNLPNVFKTFPNIVYLELNWSNITLMNALSLPNKTMLNLLSTYESHIHHLNGSFFKKAENLKNFTISFGTIGAISPEVITGVTKGKELSLAGNKIHYLPFDVFTLLTDLAGKGVNMHDNEIHSFSDTDEETPEAYAKPRKANRGLLLGISLLLCVLLLGCVAVVATFYFRRRQSEIDFNQLLSELNSGSESERGLHYEAPASCLQV